MESKMPTLFHALHSEADKMHDMQTPHVTRIISDDEKLVDVMREAMQTGRYVFTNGKRSMIAKIAPKGFWRIDGGIKL